MMRKDLPVVGEQSRRQRRALLSLQYREETKGMNL
jgi:hypothetical protein